MVTEGSRVTLRAERSDSHHNLARLSIAISSLGLALLEAEGTLSNIALLWLTTSLGEAWVALWADAPIGRRLAQIVAALCLVLPAAMLMLHPYRAHQTPTAVRVSIALVVAIVMTAFALYLATDRRQPALFFVLAGLVAALGWWLLRTLPPPVIDVLIFQKDSAEGLLRGVNPYSLEFRDPYQPEASARFYGPGISVDGVLKFGYPYMPLTLLMALPGYLLGDVRFASLCAMIGSAFLIAFARRTRASMLAGALLLTTPAFPMMLVLSWVDTYVVLLIAATWYCQCRAPKLLPYVAGLLFASKQYMIIAVPVLLFILPQPWTVRKSIGFVARAAGVGLLVTLPMALGDLKGFIHSAVVLQFRQPFRLDALSYLAWLNPANPGRWMSLPFVASALAWALIFLRRRHREVSVGLALALTFGVFFALNKQAFLNYYYLVIGCLCCALASDTGRPTDPAGATVTTAAH